LRLASRSSGADWRVLATRLVLRHARLLVPATAAERGGVTDRVFLRVAGLELAQQGTLGD
jgi:hypothetical protein